MVVTSLNAKSIFIDSAPLIYFIEGNSIYQPALSKLFSGNDNGKYTFITSTITLLEVLVHPLRSGRDEVVSQYYKLLTEAIGIEIFEVNKDIAIVAAKLRAKYTLKTPDSIQLATCIEYDADYFLTNDLRLKNIANVQTITLSDLQ